MTTDERFDEWNKTPFTQEQLRQLMNDTYEEDIMRASYRAGAREALEEIMDCVTGERGTFKGHPANPYDNGHYDALQKVLKLIEESQK